MSTYSSLKRFSIIVGKLTEKYPPTLQRLHESLQEAGFEVSERTLQRDIERLREDFGLKILYNPDNNTYSLIQRDSQYFDTLLRIIQLFNASEVLLQSLQEKNDMLKYISFENTLESAVDTKYLEAIFVALKNCKVISFEHENFDKNKISRHTIKPYLLKEYNRKWYVVGAFTDTNSIGIFGLNRIQSFSMEETTFNPKEREAIATLFNNVVGLVYDMAEPTTVQLSVTNEQAKYFKNIPLHHSQEIISENVGCTVFSYYLVPNRELQRLILGFGAQIEVIEPKWFARQIENELKSTLEKYKK